MSTPKLAINQATKAQIDSFLSDPTHALLVTGAAGSGRRQIVEYLAWQLLGSAASNTIDLSKNPYVLILGQKSPSGIDDIRSAINFTKLKIPRSEPKGSVQNSATDHIRRLIILHQAEQQTTEAQNALLKLLEEPPNDTVLFLIATQAEAMLPTITSRCRQLLVQAIGLPDAQKYFGALGFRQADITKAYHLSGGQSVLLENILKGKDTESLNKSIEQAKKLLRQTKFERLCSVDSFSKQKDTIPPLLDALQRISMAAISQIAQASLSAKNQPTGQIKAWNRRLEAIVMSQDSLQANPNSKLLLTNLFLNL